MEVVKGLRSAECGCVEGWGEKLGEELKGRRGGQSFF